MPRSAQLTSSRRQYYGRAQAARLFIEHDPDGRPAVPEWAVPSLINNSNVSSESGGSHQLILTQTSHTHLAATLEATAANVNEWSPSVHLSYEAVDYIRIVTATPIPKVWVRIHIMASAWALAPVTVPAGEGRAGVSSHSDLANHGIVAEGDDTPGIPASMEVDEFRLVQFDLDESEQDWASFRSYISGNVRTRTQGTTASANIDYRIRIAEIVDEHGIPVLARLCSAAGVDYF